MNLINLLTLLAFCGLVLSLPDQELPSNVADLKESGSQPDGSIGDVEDDTLARTEQEVEDAMAKALVFEEDEMTSIDDMNGMISSLEKDLDSEELISKRDSGEVDKRPTVNFMGIQVSYPQYLRLVKLQEKIVKLNQMIEALHSRYSQDMLNNLPQYHRLMKLHASLLPLLPDQSKEPQEFKTVNKRAPFSVDFLGLTISYPQYLRLKTLQDKVIKLDQVIGQMSSTYPSDLLESNPKWQSLRSLHTSLKKLLPPEYVSHYSKFGAQKLRTKRSNSFDFNGMLVSYPQYIRLKRLQEKVIKLDRILRKLAEKRDPSELAENAKWLELLSLRQSLQKLLPAYHPTFETNSDKRAKRNVRTDFGGIQIGDQPPHELKTGRVEFTIEHN